MPLLLRRGAGTILLPDWDGNVAAIDHPAVLHLGRDWKRLNVEELVCLIAAADLLIGVDSGPLHVARCTATPVVGVFESELHHPVRMTLPRRGQINLVHFHRGSIMLSQRARRAFDLVSSHEPVGIPASLIARQAWRLLRRAQENSAAE